MDESIRAIRAMFNTGVGHILWVGVTALCIAGLPAPLVGQYLPVGPIYYNGGNVGIGTTSVQVSVETTGSVRIDGSQAPSSGSGLELAFFDNLSYVQSIQRSPFAWQPMQFNASSYSFGIGSVGIGTAAPCASGTLPANCKLSVAGGIQAYEVVVSNNWSDYVFAPDYRLAPLSEVAAYVKENHHLPDIPSAAEVQRNGVSLGDMQAKLLAKVEELTLHMIESEERSDRLERENAELRRQTREVLERMEALHPGPEAVGPERK